MTSLESTIKKIREDLSFEFTSRDNFLAQCAYQRIKDKSKSYEESFDQYVNLLDKTESSPQDLVRFGQTLSHLSSLLTSSYEELIKMVSTYEKNLFNKKD